MLGINKSSVHFLLASTFISLVLLSPFLISRSIILPEKEKFRKQYSVGESSPLKNDHSLLWLNHFHLGVPRYTNPLLNIYYPVPYLGGIIPEPVFSYLLWIVSLVLAFWGGGRLFALFIADRNLAFLAGVLFVLSGVLYNSAIIGIVPDQLPLTCWALYNIVKGVRDKSIINIMFAALLHALHFMASCANYLWFYVSAAIGFYIFMVEGYRYATQRKVVQLKRIAVAIIGYECLFFGILLLLIAVSVLPMMGAIPYLSHRDVPMGSAFYQHDGSLRLEELFYFPYLFPGIFKTDRQLSSFVNLSYLGYVPFVFGIIWITIASIKKRLWLLSALVIILFAAASLPPIDNMLRLIPLLKEVRLSSAWMLVWNLILIVLSIKTIERLQDRETLLHTIRLSIFVYTLVLIILFFLISLHMYRFGYIPVPSYLIDVDSLNVYEAVRPLIVGIFLMVILVLAFRSRITHRGMILLLSLVAVADIISWDMNITLNELSPAGGSLAKYVNAAVANVKENDAFYPTLGEGRTLIFGLPEDKQQSGQFSIYLGNFEKVFSPSSLTLKRSHAISKLLGWAESDVIYTGQVYSKMTLKEFLFSERRNVARAFNVRYYFSNSELPAKLLVASHVKAHASCPGIGMFLYEDIGALPRVALFNSWHETINFENALEYIVKNANKLTSAPVVEMPKAVPERSIKSGLIDGSVIESVDYQPSRILIKCRVKEKALLYVSDTNYVDWQAWIDGKRAQIHSVNIGGRGIFIDSGNHVVMFTLVPYLFYAGAIVTLLCLVTVVVVIIVVWRNNRRIGSQNQHHSIVL